MLRSNSPWRSRDEKQLVEHEAADRRDHDRDEQSWPVGEPHGRQRERHREGSNHQELAVGEIDDLQHAEDERKADGDQGIEQAERDAVDA